MANGLNMGLRITSQHKLLVQNDTLQKDISFNFDRIFDPSDNQ